MQTWTLFPARQTCAFCARAGTARTCADCRAWTYLDGLSYLSPYANVSVRKLIGAWKYYTDRTAEPILEILLRRAAATMSPPALAFFATHVPLHESRARERGFDQAQTVAMFASDIFGIPREDYLHRARKTNQQASASKDNRQVGKMDGAFETNSDAVIPDHILLCDDVFTSGSTMDAAARALKEAGAKTVWGYVIARGG
jgi:predicted amidophosphoribosyltransferase